MSGTFVSHRIVIPVVVALMAAGGLWWAYSRHPALEDTATATEAGPAPAADGSIVLSQAQWRAQGIETAPVGIATQLPVPGLPAQSVAPLSASAQAVTPYAGVVVRLLADEGETVREGQALAYIQSRDMLAAQGELARARGEAAAASSQARRDAALLDEGIIPAAREEQSRARDVAAQSALNQASGALARLRPVAGRAGEYALLAPMSGRIVRRLLAPGQAVAAWEAAFVIAAPGVVDVNFAAPLRLGAAIAPGLPVRLANGAMARVAAVGADADPSSQSLRVRARVEPEQNSDAPLVAGQQFSVSLLLPAPEGALAVPPAALLPAGQHHVMYVADGGKDSNQGDLRIRAVTVQLLGGDASLSVVLPVKTEGDATTPAPTGGMRVVSRGAAMLRALIPAQ